MTTGAWTGDALLVTLACYKKRISKLRALKMLAISYLGCSVGIGMCAALATGAALPMCKPWGLLHTSGSSERGAQRVGCGLAWWASPI